MPRKAASKSKSSSSSKGRSSKSHTSVMARNMRAKEQQYMGKITDVFCTERTSKAGNVSKSYRIAGISMDGLTKMTTFANEANAKKAAKEGGVKIKCVKAAPRKTTARGKAGKATKEFCKVAKKYCESSEEEEEESD
jgi:hypothetical protein